MSEVLLKTVHGSHLYGLAHAGSDYDFYEVVATPEVKFKNQHTVEDGVDVSLVTFASFFEMCHEGIPQALEALYSQKAEIDKLAYFRNSFRVGSSIYDSYHKAITQCIRKGDFKRRRHALRLSLNVRDLMNTGIFNPTLTPTQVMEISELANSTDDEFLTGLRAICPMPVGHYETHT
jgi:hypothetical protein